MPGAEIKIDQDRTPDPVSYGTPGVPRKDLWLNKEITFTSTQPGNSSISWFLLAKPPGSAAVLVFPEVIGLHSTCKLTPDVKGSYRIQLTTNNGGVGNVQVLIAAVTFDENGEELDFGVRIPAFGETTGEENAWDGNTDGWAEAIGHFMSTTIEQLALGGTSAKPYPVELNFDANVDVAAGGLLTEQGYTLQEGDAVLLSAQTDATEVGVWTASSAAWSRHELFATGARFRDGTFISIRRGTYEKAVWSIFWSDPDGGKILGTDELVAQSGSGTPGPAGPVGPSSNLWFFYAETTVGGDPSVGHIRWNNATQISSTALHIDLTTGNTEDVTFFLKILSSTDKIALYGGDSTDYQIWQVTGTPTMHVGLYAEVPVALLDSGGSGTTGFVAETNLYASVLRSGANGSAGAGYIFIYDSGATPAGPVYSNFASLMLDRATIPGPAIIIYNETSSFPVGSFDFAYTTLHIPEGKTVTIGGGTTINSLSAISGSGTLANGGGTIALNGGFTTTITDTVVNQGVTITPLITTDDDLSLIQRGSSSLVATATMISIDSGKNLTLSLYDQASFKAATSCDAVFTVNWHTPDAKFIAPNGCPDPVHVGRHINLIHKGYAIFANGDNDTEVSYKTEADLFADITAAIAEKGPFPLEIHLKSDITFPDAVNLYRKVKFIGGSFGDRPTVTTTVNTQVFDPCEFYRVAFSSSSGAVLFAADTYTELEAYFECCRFSSSGSPIFDIGAANDIIRMNTCSAVAGSTEPIFVSGNNATLLISQGTTLAANTIRSTGDLTVIGDTTSSVDGTQTNYSGTLTFYGGGLVSANNTVLAGLTKGSPGSWTADLAINSVSVAYIAVGSDPAASGQIRATELTSLIAYKHGVTDYSVAEIDASGHFVLGNTSRGGVTLQAKSDSRISFYSGATEKATVDANGITLIGSGAVALSASSTATSVTHTQNSTNIAAAVGAPLYIQAQHSIGTGATVGGLVYLGSGSGATNGEVQIGTGGVVRMTLTPTGKTLYWAADLTTNVTLTQAATTGASVTGAKMTVESQSSNGTGGIGAELSFVTGAGTTRAGYMTFYRGATQRGQIGSGSTAVAGGIWWGRINTASGNDSIILGTNNIASNDFSIAIGNGNSSTASVSIAIGTSNSIGGSADYSVAIGYTNTINTSFSFAIGIGCTANQQGSIAMGVASYTSVYGEIAQASGAASGTPQNSSIQISGTTTATASTNVDLKAGPSANLEIVTRTGRIYKVHVEFVATSANFSLYGGITLKNALIKNDAGTVTVLKAGDQEAVADTPADWVLSLSGSGANLRVNFLKTADPTALYCSAKVILVDVAKP